LVAVLPIYDVFRTPLPLPQNGYNRSGLHHFGSAL
jgi:hypothetical protein